MNIDKEISEMAGRIAEQTEEILEAKDKQIKIYEHEIVYLDKKIEVLRKALELLIENTELESCIYCPCAIDFNKKHHREIEFACSCENRDGCKECFENIKDYFIQQAKESLK